MTLRTTGHGCQYALRGLSAMVMFASLLLVSLSIVWLCHPPRVQARALDDTTCTPASFAADVTQTQVMAVGHVGSIVFNCPAPGPRTIDVRAVAGGPGTVRVAPTSSLSVSSVGAGVILDGHLATQVFHVGSGAALTLSHLTVANGNALASIGGGAVENEGGSVSITAVTFAGNLAQASTNVLGGAILNSGGILAVRDSSFSANKAQAGAGRFGLGGAVANVYSPSSPGAVTIASSTFTGNLASGGPGGLGSGGALFQDGGDMLVVNSTLVANQATGGLGGALFYAAGTTELTNSTVVRNAASQGGALAGRAGTASVANSIVANNTADTGSNCLVAGTMTDRGHNLEDSATGADCGFSKGAPVDDQLVDTSADLKLGTLASNGGPNQTVGLAAGSPALDQADPAICAAVPVSGTDQRGVARPQASRCDIGAYEMKPPTVTITIGQPSGTSGGATHVTNQTPVTISGDDLGPGVAALSFCVFPQGAACSSGPTTMSRATAVIHLDGVRPGVYAITCSASDALGNGSAPQSATLTLDPGATLTVPTTLPQSGPRSQGRGVAPPSGAVAPSGKKPARPASFPLWLVLLPLLLTAATGAGCYLVWRRGHEIAPPGADALSYAERTHPDAQ